AAFRQPPVLRTVGAVDGTSRVARRRCGPPRRRRSVLATLTRRQVVLADVRRLQERELILAHRVPPLLRFGSQGWNPSVGRVDDQRRPAPGVLVREEDRGVVSAADVLFAPSRVRPIVLRQEPRSSPVELGSLLV